MEIEKKFLLEKLPFDMTGYEQIKIKQSYISTAPVIRLRMANDKFILTVKGKGTLAKEEFELQLSQEEFERLSKKTEENTFIIDKIRYLVPLNDGLLAEVDEYFGVLNGLHTVEVEFDSIKQANEFIPPDWFGKDVTMDTRFSNASLSKFGYHPEYL